jgi:hypothetical protein
MIMTPLLPMTVKDRPVHHHRGGLVDADPHDGGMPQDRRQ